LGASLIAAAINDRGDMAGVYTNGSGTTDGYLLSHGQFTDLSVPGSTSTMALGVNNFDEVGRSRVGVARAMCDQLGAV
jgi:hypothetical protein